MQIGARVVAVVVVAVLVEVVVVVVRNDAMPTHPPFS